MVTPPPLPNTVSDGIDKENGQGSSRTGSHPVVSRLDLSRHFATALSGAITQRASGQTTVGSPMLTSRMSPNGPHMTPRHAVQMTARFASSPPASSPSVHMTPRR